MRPLALLTLMVGCGSAPPAKKGEPTCTERFADLDPPTTRDALQPYVDIALEAYYPELEGISLTLIDMAADSPYFSANLDLTTVERPPLERDYRIQAHPEYFDAPLAPTHATGAVLVHELKHILDYTEMTSEELGEFGLWYATAEDVSEYERQTDEGALERGCGEGLKAYREWMYPRLTPEEVEQKRHNYYTPEEIDAWIEANG